MTLTPEQLKSLRSSVERAKEVGGWDLTMPLPTADALVAAAEERDRLREALDTAWDLIATLEKRLKDAGVPAPQVLKEGDG
jgi:hypothetical protein